MPYLLAISLPSNLFITQTSKIMALRLQFLVHSKLPLLQASQAPFPVHSPPPSTTPSFLPMYATSGFWSKLNPPPIPFPFSTSFRCLESHSAFCNATSAVGG